MTKVKAETLTAIVHKQRQMVALEIRKMRLAKKLSWLQVADYCRVSLRTVHSWAYSQRMPSSENLRKLDELFKL